MRPLHILIFEPEAGGHQMNFVRYLLGGMSELAGDARVTLLSTSDTAEHPDCQALLRDFSSLVTLRIAPPVAEGNRFFRALDPFYERQWRHTEAFTRDLALFGPDQGRPRAATSR